MATGQALAGGQALRRPPTGWGHRTGRLEAVAFSFAVRSTDRRLGRYVEWVLGSLRAPGHGTRLSVEDEATHWYSLIAGNGDGGTATSFDVVFDDESVCRSVDAPTSVAWLLWHLNQQAAASSGEGLALHAGAVQFGATGVLVPGPSGAGKTTLVAGLVHAGMDYLSDELVVLDSGGSQLLPYPKPLVVEPGSQPVIAALVRGGVDDAFADLLGDQRYVVADDIRPRSVGARCRAGVVITPRYRPGSRSTLVPMSAEDAFVELATATVNLPRHGGRGVETLSRLARECRCYRLEMAALDDACALVLDALAP